MTTIRDPLETSSSSGPMSLSNPDNLQQNTSSPEQPTTEPESTFDSTHQVNEETYEKIDQKLEASDPDIQTASSDSFTVDQDENVMDTPISNEIQEEETVSSDDSPKGGSLALKNEQSDSGLDGKTQSSQIKGDHNVKGTPNSSKHIQDMTSNHLQGGATASVPIEIHSNEAETNREAYEQRSLSGKDIIPGEEGLSKHARWVAEDQAKERYDYLAGAYKSPYRHMHKAEKVGREEM
ncbi:hypothetical protein FBU30_002758 [Linnemannia zychae]|nr:hypothetical protein FBU30_002758 [Linnemannia zychae]